MLVVTVDVAAAALAAAAGGGLMGLLVAGSRLKWVSFILMTTSCGSSSSAVTHTTPRTCSLCVYCTRSTHSCRIASWSMRAVACWRSSVFDAILPVSAVVGHVMPSCCTGRCTMLNCHNRFRLHVVTVCCCCSMFFNIIVRNLSATKKPINSLCFPT